VGPLMNFMKGHMKLLNVHEAMYRVR